MSMPRGKPKPDAELEALRRKVDELEDVCEKLRLTNEELRQSKWLATVQKQAEELLTVTVDSLPEGFLYFDAQDRLVLVNNRIADIYPLVADVFVPGVSYETCMRTGLDRGQWGPDDGQNKEEWIQKRLAHHYDPKGTVEFNLPNGRCIRVEEKKTPQGGIVGLRTDITELKKAEELLKMVIDSMPEGFAYYDAGDRLALFNSSLAKTYPLITDMYVLGTSFEEILRKGVEREQYGPIDGQDIEDWIQERLAYHRDPKGAVEYDLPDGRCIRVEEKKTPEGGIVGVRTDITDLKKIERQLLKSEERFKAFFENSPAAIYLKDLKKCFVLVNKQFANVHGVDSEEVIGKTSFNLFPKEIAEKFSSQDEKVLASGISLQEEMETLYKDGETATILTTKFPIIGSDGNVEGVGGINLDITERKEIERMKHEFISIASHELRTPLTSLKGALDLIHSDVVGQIPEAMAPLLEIAHRNSERLGRLIDDILDIEKLDAEKMEFSMQPIPVPGLIDQAISEHAGFGIEHGVSFVIDGDVPNVAVLGDEDRLMQVFSNLMSNAAKFSAEGTVVRLLACEKGQGVRISITDEGQGIPEVFHDKVFEKFTRADNSDSGLQYGTGLGLSIAKAVVERHGGNIGFKTETDVGTTFFFDLPKAGQ